MILATGALRRNNAVDQAAILSWSRATHEQRVARLGDNLESLAAARVAHVLVCKTAKSKQLNENNGAMKKKNATTKRNCRINGTDSLKYQDEPAAIVVESGA